jgi:Chitin synthase N-terminal
MDHQQNTQQPYVMYNGQPYNVPPTPPDPMVQAQTLVQSESFLTRTHSIKPKNGNFVLQIPIAKELLKDAQYTTEEEFTHTNYTAVTCEPDDFPARYSLRQKRYNRPIKIALVVTMYV